MRGPAIHLPLLPSELLQSPPLPGRRRPRFAATTTPPTTSEWPLRNFVVDGFLTLHGIHTLYTRGKASRGRRPRSPGFSIVILPFRLFITWPSEPPRCASVARLSGMPRCFSSAS
jgi:hypothetical protein